MVHWHIMARYGLYAHIPFCQTKCGYCDFYSVALNNRPTSPLVSAVAGELNRRTSDAAVDIRTIFVGGGTPTVLPHSDLRRLMDAFQAITTMNDVVEFTVEANPATVDDEKLSILTEAGINRISLGAQSWHTNELATLERLHAPEDTTKGVEAVRRHGVGRINLDLIFGIPGQTLDTWRESLRRTIDLGVDHVACYGLTYEKGTPLTAQLDAGRIDRIDESLEADMYLLAIDTLAEHGYEQYEISNFARPGQVCLHNMTYWRHEPYIGVGPSACGCVDGLRYKNVANVEAYVRRMDEFGDAVAESEHVTGAALAGEAIMMQLRLNEGIDVGEFLRTTGINPLTACQRTLERFAELGLMNVSHDTLSLTRRGRLLADSIILDLFTELHTSLESVGGIA